MPVKTAQAEIADIKAKQSVSRAKLKERKEDANRTEREAVELKKNLK